ncbi:MAG: hypothetical protein M0Q94_08175 [Candidatus Cloacimonetes bacterium]|nr:hypothetical protein [Candidatus Cloacimonadota bacterium]
MKEIESCELEKLRDVFCNLPCGVAVLKLSKTIEVFSKLKSDGIKIHEL